ncbi:MAG: hypothetical protein WC634_03530 [archaeon]
MPRERKQRFRVIKDAVGHAAGYYRRKNSLVRQALSIEQGIAKTTGKLPKPSEATQLLEEARKQGNFDMQKVSRLKLRLSTARKKMIAQKEALSRLLKQAEHDKVELPAQKRSEEELEQRIEQLNLMIAQLDGIINPATTGQPNETIKPLFTIKLNKRNH